jgi:hypothetical protein
MATLTGAGPDEPPVASGKARVLGAKGGAGQAG